MIHFNTHREVSHQIGWIQIGDWRIEFWTYWVWGFVPHNYSLGFIEVCKTLGW